jgi:hypothetical protein
MPGRVRRRRDGAYDHLGPSAGRGRPFVAQRFRETSVQEKIDYKGRTISVETTKRGNGWTWAYQIDTGPLRQGRDRPLESEELMLKEAIREAQREIDSMG